MGMRQQQNAIVYTLESETSAIGFGELDGKGRELGMSIGTATLTAGYGPMIHRTYEHRGRTYGDNFADETHTYYPHGETLDREPGVYFTAYCHATRAGKAFGASQSRELFTTAADRDAWIEKRIAGARRRAPKAAITGRAGRRAQQ